MAFSNLLLITFVAFAAAGLATTTAQSSNFTAFHDSTSVTNMTYISATPNGASSPPVVATSIESSSPVVATSIKSLPPVVATSIESSSPVVATSIESFPPVVAASIESSPPVVATSIESSPPVVAASIESSPPVVATSIEVTPSRSSGSLAVSSIYFNLSDPVFFDKFLEKYKHLFSEFSCTNKAICCDGKGNSTIKVKVKDCKENFPGHCNVNSTFEVNEKLCLDTTMIPCCSQAAFLNTSLVLIVLGVFLHLVGN